MRGRPVCARPCVRGGRRAAYDAIVSATTDALAGRIDAVATAPVNKEAFAAAGLPWRGHTDLLAHLTEAPRVAMMFYAESLRVILATVHIALSEIPRALTREVVEGTIDLAWRELPRFGITSPRLALAGLNPHAGEHGDRARRRRGLAPAVAALRSRGVSVDGPFPADTVFVRAMRGEFDAVVACYHDQADPDQAGRVRGSQRDAWPADCPDLGRSRTRI
jgi:4-hydroxythreonine-4-phosphate dehydrogenase